MEVVVSLLAVLVAASCLLTLVAGSFRRTVKPKAQAGALVTERQR